jgi:hypothetical protein
MLHPLPSRPPNRVCSTSRGGDRDFACTFSGDVGSTVRQLRQQNQQSTCHMGGGRRIRPPASVRRKPPLPQGGPNDSSK